MKEVSFKQEVNAKGGRAVVNLSFSVTVQLVRRRCPALQSHCPTRRPLLELY